MRALLKSSHFLVGLVKSLRAIPEDLQRLAWTLRRGGQIAAYLAEPAPHKLQIGCGRNHLAGWLNTDYAPRTPGAVYLDATQRFPFADATFDFAFSEHVIEHLGYLDGQNLLREAWRTLRPGGLIRIATPNLLNLATLLDEPLDDLRRRYIRRAVERYMQKIGIEEPGFVFNNFIWDFGHIFVYDPKTLAIALKAAGFIEPQLRAIGQSEIPTLANLETHGQVVGEDLNEFETMVMEARKPRP